MSRFLTVMANWGTVESDRISHQTKKYNKEIINHVFVLFYSTNSINHGVKRLLLSKERSGKINRQG